MSLVGCLFKYCGYDGGCGLQFGFSSSSSISSDVKSSMNSSNISGGSGSSKSFGALLNHCVISFCGEAAVVGSGGGGVGVGGGRSDSIRLVYGSSAELRRCTITQSAADSIRVLHGSTMTMTRCCVHASAAAAVVFEDRGTGKLIDCQVLATAGNGLELSGDRLFMCCADARHHIALIALQELLMSSSRGDASALVGAMEYRHTAAAKSLFLACTSARMPPMVF